MRKKPPNYKRTFLPARNNLSCNSLKTATETCVLRAPFESSVIAHVLRWLLMRLFLQHTSCWDFGEGQSEISEVSAFNISSSKGEGKATHVEEDAALWTNTCELSCPSSECGASFGFFLNNTQAGKPRDHKCLGDTSVMATGSAQAGLVEAVPAQGRGWNRMGLQGPPNPTHSGIPWWQLLGRAQGCCPNFSYFQVFESW